jgi:hypothetical protein
MSYRSNETSRTSEVSAFIRPHKGQHRGAARPGLAGVVARAAHDLDRVQRAAFVLAIDRARAQVVGLGRLPAVWPGSGVGEE